MDSISLDFARNNLSAAYKKEVKDAAGDGILDKNEQAQLSPWANKVLDKLRSTTTGPLKTKDAMDEMNGKVRRALTAISSDHTRITRDEAKALYVTELRTKVLDLFAPKNTDTAALKKAIDATDIPLMTDYNKGFQWKSFAASASLADIAEDLTGEEMGDDSWLDLKKDKKGLESFLDVVREQGKTEKDDAEDAADGKLLKKLHDDVADEVEALFGDKSKFTEFYYHYNGIVEDGATEWAILVGKRTDGTFTAVTYSNFPF